ncbi:MAG: oligosaccharide flippase family protein [Bacilli bacterium]|jgi:stage V sporulation protein B
MKKEKFIKATLILIIGGFLTKVLGMFIRIVQTRLIGLEGIGLYMLILPTFSLFITLAQLGLPVALSKLIAEDRKDNKRLLMSAIPIIIVVNIILIIIIIIIAPFLAKYLLSDRRTLYPLLSIAVVLPFISLSCIVRSYFFGKQQMFPHVLSHIVEQITRLLAILIIVPILYQRSITLAVSGVVLVNIFSELMSIIILGGYLPKHAPLKTNLKPHREDIKEILDIGLPTTGGKVIGSISYFLEPIILTQVLLSIGYSNHFIVTEYGILTGYVFPLLFLPSFFTQAISSVLIPVISEQYVHHNIIYIKTKLNQAILFSLIIGLVITTLYLLYPHFFLKLIYNTEKGINYLRILSPVFLLYYIQLPLTATLQALGKAKIAMFNALKSVTLKTLLLFLLSFLHIGIGGLIIATATGIVVLTTLDFYQVKQHL